MITEVPEGLCTVYVCLCNHVLVEVDVQQACFPLTADHERLVEAAVTLSAQTLTPVCEDPPHLLVQSLTKLNVNHVHFICTPDVRQEMSAPENLDNTWAKKHTHVYKQMGRENAEPSVNAHLISTNSDSRSTLARKIAHNQNNHQHKAKINKRRVNIKTNKG